MYYLQKCKNKTSNYKIENEKKQIAHKLENQQK